MKERRHMKKNSAGYKKLNRDITMEIKKDNECYLSQKCTKELELKHNTFNLYRKKKEFTGKKQQTSHTNTNSDDKLITDSKEKIYAWEDHNQTTF